MADPASLGSVVFERLCAILKADPDIDELGLLVDAEGVGDVDSAFICENHKLGVAYWCLPALYTHAVRLLRPLLALPDPPAEQVMLATGVATLINADNYTAWNARKRLLIAAALPLDRELAHLDLVFSKHPKSAEAWAHRRYVAARALAGAESAARDELLAREVRVCARVAEAYPKNYYAWTHRAWVCKHMATEALAGELAAGRQWVERHVSDHSGAHHCYTVLRLWLRQDAPGAEAALVEHATAVRSLIITYPGHEALWSHVRALLSLWLQLRAGRPAHCAGVTDETGAEELEAALRCSAAEGDESDTDSSGSVGSEVGPPACADAGRKATEYLRAEWELATRCLRDRMADDFATQRALAARHAAWVALQLGRGAAASMPPWTARVLRSVAGAGGVLDSTRHNLWHAIVANEGQ